MFFKKIDKNIKSIHPSVILIIFLLLTLILTLLTEKAINARHQERLQQLSERIASSVSSRLERYERSLIHIRAYFNTHPNISRTTFKNYIQNLILAENYPGIQGLGYTARIKEKDLRKYEAQVRSEGFKDFKVWPEHPREEYFSIHFLEPFDWRNQRAFGFDMFTQPKRALAMSLARDTSEAIKTQIVTLVQETGKQAQPGFLLYLPVYSSLNIPESIEERREKLKGFIYAPFRAFDFFNGIFKSELKTHREVSVEIFDSPNITSSELIYNNNILFEDELSPKSNISRIQPLPLNGQEWTLVTTYRQGLSLILEQLVPWVVFIGGCFLSFLIFWIVYAEKKHAQEMEISLTKFNALFTNLTEGLVFASPAGEIQLMNKEALRLFQIEEGNIPKYGHDQHFTIRFPNGSEVPSQERPIQKVIKGETFSNYELEYEHHLSKNKMFLSFGGTAIYDKKKNILFIVVTVRDVTEKKQFELDLQQAINARDEFVSISSHELKTPLTSLKLKIQIFKRKFSKKSDTNQEEDFKKFLDVADQQVSRLSRLVDDMLDISRIRARKFSLKKEEIDFYSLVKSILDQLKPHFLQAGYLEPTLHGCNKVMGYWDPLRIEQVINNLLTNAIRYGEGKPISLEIESDDKFVRLYVKDQGAGISQEQQQRIFNRFERLTEVHETTGLGLGLYLSQQIMDAHGGKISVKSEPSRGSCFIIELPLFHD